jgi:hypothetical protein
MWFCIYEGFKYTRRRLESEVTTYGANPTIVSYDAVKIYNATSSLVGFENKTIFIYFEKR